LEDDLAFEEEQEPSYLDEAKLPDTQLPEVPTRLSDRPETEKG
jgi:hypothetical protein